MPSLSFRCNNPGNIRKSAWAERYGATGAEYGMAVFPTVIQGLSCMVALLGSANYRELTLLEAITRYAPAADNNRPQEYAGYVAHRAGVPQDMRLADMDPFQLLRVIEAMVRFEGWKE